MRTIRYFHCIECGTVKAVDSEYSGPFKFRIYEININEVRMECSCDGGDHTTHRYIKQETHEL